MRLRGKLSIYNLENKPEFGDNSKSLTYSIIEFQYFFNHFSEPIGTDDLEDKEASEDNICHEVEYFKVKLCINSVSKCCLPNYWWICSII